MYDTIFNDTELSQTLVFSLLQKIDDLYYNYEPLNKQKICDINLFLINCFKNINTYIEDVSKQQKIKKHINRLGKLIKIIEKEYKGTDSYIYYSCITLRNMLEELIDKQFMDIVGKTNWNELVKEYGSIERAIIYYAKGVLKAEIENT